MCNDLITELSPDPGIPRKVLPAASRCTGFTTFRMPFVLAILMASITHVTGRRLDFIVISLLSAAAHYVDDAGADYV